MHIYLSPGNLKGARRIAMIEMSVRQQNKPALKLILVKIFKYSFNIVTRIYNNTVSVSVADKISIGFDNTGFYF